MACFQTEEDRFSLYHAASLGFWGVHDRTALLSEAVSFTLSDVKAQFLLYDRWSQHTTMSAAGTPTKNVSKTDVTLHVVCACASLAPPPFDISSCVGGARRI